MIIYLYPYWAGPNQQFNGKEVFQSVKNSHNLRIAIVHEWLTIYAGAERLLEKMQFDLGE